MVDVRIFKTAHHLHDGIDFADRAEELVSQAFALGGALDQPGDINELDIFCPFPKQKNALPSPP